MSAEVFLAGAVRTPIGSFQGALSTVSAVDLGALATSAAIERAGIAPDQVDEVLFGNVIGAGLGQNVARRVGLAAGLPPNVGATTVNKVCGSGLKAVMCAAQEIKCGDADIVLAGGTENMSLAPYLLPKARTGYRMGHGEILDSMIHDGLWDIYNQTHMGTHSDRTAREYEFTRRMLDDFAIESYKRALAAWDRGWFDDEVVPVDVPGRKGAVAIVDRDEEPQRFNEVKLRALNPAFGHAGTTTAGNASSINDGAAAVVVMSAKSVEQLGVTPQARLIGYAAFAREPERFTLAPINATRNLLERIRLNVDDIDLFEVNEAFASVAMAAMRDLGIDRDKMNVHGGAVALGHPIGASGARTLVTLIHAVRRHDVKRGLTTLCIGGGEAVAMAIERV